MLDPRERELEEVRRSAREALRLAAPSLAAKKLIARYGDPPGDTAFPLEYAYYLVGDLACKTVLDYGCGAGGNSLLLAMRGAFVTGIDISPELVEIAKHRFEINSLSAEFRVASGYDTGLPDSSMDLIFCMGVLHHLDLVQARAELLRVLKPYGFLIMKEPVRDSRSYAFVRGLVPYTAHQLSEYERPLNSREIDDFAAGMSCEAKRRFALPFVPLARMISRRLLKPAIYVDRWLLKTVPILEQLATIEVRKLRKAPL
jgi:2-polyprenyl-3-methyl-5-hydroxy-6-metoxy-1,4-benzoquinol methylase